MFRVTESGALEGISKVKKTANGREHQKDSTLWVWSCIVRRDPPNLPRPAGVNGVHMDQDSPPPVKAFLLKTPYVVAVAVPTVWLCKNEKKNRLTLLDTHHFLKALHPDPLKGPPLLLHGDVKRSSDVLHSCHFSLSSLSKDNYHFSEGACL